MASTERRVVSVVFADLAGFTSLSERLDPEDVASIQESYFGRAAEVIAEHGGRVEKFVGDAVMAVFGVEAATDDDAAQAVRAGRRLLDVVRETADSLGLPPDTLALRVGVNTGEVVVTRAAGEWRVTGDVVNTAARLQTAAPPGDVLLGPETAFGVAHAFELEPAGELRLRGKAEPLATYRPGAERHLPARGLASHGLRAPTLGRDDVVADLLGRATAPGAPRAVVLLLAPPGVGKTRVVEEVAERARAAGTPVLAARVTRGGPYDAVRDLMHIALGTGRSVGPGPDRAAGDLASRLTAAGVPESGTDVVVRHVTALLDGGLLDAEPADLFPSWAAALEALSGPTPLVVVEDLQHAGQDLIAFLGHLAQGLVGGLVLLTGRPEAAHRLDAAESGRRWFDVVHLSPLDRDATAELVTSLVGTGTLPERYLRGIVGVSGGNPLFVEELLRSWILGGVLAERDGAWTFTEHADEPALPSTVQGIYQAQLDRLPAGTRAVVDTGSVPGTTFPAGALPVLGVDEPDPALRTLTGVGLLSGPHAHAVDERSYTYRHAVLRDTAYASLARARRAALHARFARWLAGQGAAELVGMHLVLALEALPATARDLEGRPTAEVGAEAADWLERAAAEHLVPSPQRAAGLLERALAVAPDAARPDRLRRTLTLAEALRRAGRLQEAMVAFRDAAVLARGPQGTATPTTGGPDPRRGSDPTALVTAALGYEHALFDSRLPRQTWGGDSLDLLREALAAVGDDGPDLDRVRLLAALGRALVYSGRREEGVAVGTEAVRIAETAGDPAAIAEAHLALRAAQDAPHHLAERLAGITKVAAAAAGTGDDELRFEAARLELIDRLQAGDIAGADRARSIASELAASLGRPVYQWYPPMWAAMRALLAGQHADVPALVEAFVEQARRSHYADAHQVATILRLELHLVAGDPGVVLDEVRARAAASPDRWGFALAVLLARLGDRDGARRELVRYAADGFASVVPDLSWTTTMAYLAEAGAIVGTPEECAALAERLRPWSGHVVVTGSGALCLGSVDHFLGLALLGAGDVEAAAAHLRSAVTTNDELGAPGRATLSRSALARTLQAAGHDDEARATLDRARADAARLGMRDPAGEPEPARITP